MQIADDFLKIMQIQIYANGANNVCKSTLLNIYVYYLLLFTELIHFMFTANVQCTSKQPLKVEVIVAYQLNLHVFYYSRK